jgi:hypothetical protein
VLSIADMDDRIQPGFGKAKICVLVEQQASGMVSQKERLRLELALPMRLPVRGSDPKFRLICLMPTTRLFEKAIPSALGSQTSRRAWPRSEVRSLRRRDPVCDK